MNKSEHKATTLNFKELYMNKAEHKSTNPDSYAMRVWNQENLEQYFRSEHKETNPDSDEICAWNKHNDEKYELLEISV